MLEFYTALLIYLFFLASQGFHTFKLFSNLHTLGLAFFYSRDVFGIFNFTVTTTEGLCNKGMFWLPLYLVCFDIETEERGAMQTC